MKRGYIKGVVAAMALALATLCMAWGGEGTQKEAEKETASEKDAAEEGEATATWIGVLDAARMQHPVLHDDQRYLRFDDGAERIVLFAKGAALPEAGRRVRLVGHEEVIDLGGKAGTKGSYRGMLLRVRRWAYAPAAQKKGKTEEASANASTPAPTPATEAAPATKAACPAAPPKAER